MKVLLTEDDDKLRGELARFFQMHGYETREITDYKNAVEKSAVREVIFCFWTSLCRMQTENISAES